MDYSLCTALKASNIGNLTNIILLYDVNCQYHVHFKRRIANAPTLEVPDDKVFYWGIGEFHVTAHIPQCYVRHSPQFIPGAGHIDGEILETLWSTLNECFPGTQSSTLANRSETIDVQVQESNSQKALNIGKQSIESRIILNVTKA